MNAPMSAKGAPAKHTYRLVLCSDGRGVERRIEFEAYDPAAALLVLQREARGREVALLEDQRPLGTLKLNRRGFWTFSAASRR